MRNPVEKLDPMTCVDFSTKGNLITDKYRRGWELAFGKKKKKKSRCPRSEG